MAYYSHEAPLPQGHVDQDSTSHGTPRQTYNNRHSFASSDTTETTTSTSSSSSTSTYISDASASTYTGASSTATGDSSSRRSSGHRVHRRTSSSASSIVEAEIMDLEQMIYKIKEQLELHKRRADAEERRANEAEAKLQQYADHLAKVNKARLAAQQEANRANEELRLYKIQLEYAQREINRAQSVLNLVEKQRCAAEKEAAEAKSKARKLNEEIVIENARREGRRQGLQEGLDRGRQLIMNEAEAAIPRVLPSRASLSLSQRSFMNQDYGSDSDDTRTISTESHITLQADGRRRRHSYATSDSRSLSPEPLPVPAPAPAPRPPTGPPSIAPSTVAPTRPASRAHSAVPDPRPTSRAPSVIAEPPRPSSRATSVAPEYRPSSKAPSKAPSVIQESRPASRASRAPSAAHEPPSHSRAPSVADIRPISVQGNHSPMMPMNYTLPPDNLIPTIVNGVIAIPPAFEFHKMPHTPERQPSPKLPTDSFDSAHTHIRRQSSPETASTTLSHIDILRDPYTSHQPHLTATPALSAIEEVSSQGMSSPYYPDTSKDFRKYSTAGSSVGRGGGGSTIAGSPYIDHSRRRSVSSIVPSIIERPPSVSSKMSRRASAQGTPIQIQVQPPSHPGTEGTRSITKSEQLSPLPPDTIPLGSSSYNGSPAGSTSVPMPGGVFSGSRSGTSRAPSPAPTTQENSNDDDAVSSQISGDGDWFATPAQATKKMKAPESVVSAASGKTSKTNKTSKSKASRKGR